MGALKALNAEMSKALAKSAAGANSAEADLATMRDALATAKRQLDQETKRQLDRAQLNQPNRTGHGMVRRIQGTFEEHFCHTSAQ